MRTLRSLFRRAALGAVFGILAVAAPAGAASDLPPAFGLPIDCDPGRTCWIVNYVDHDPGPGFRDYACGRATYNGPAGKGHNGTDFAIRDGNALRAGVAVLAAADGVVKAIRDGVADADIEAEGPPPASDGRECGNGVVLDHGDGWQTQYCHLGRGSVAVVPGQRVVAGRRLGFVGLSGFTQFPHLHVTFRRDDAIVDPFVGPRRKSECGLGENPLWNAATLARLPYRPTAIYAAGFASEKPVPARVRNGGYAVEQFDRKASALVLWTDLFNVRAGDRILMTLRGPDGSTVLRHAHPLTKDQARFFAFAGRPRPGDGWAVGPYEGEIRLERDGGGRSGDPPSPLTVRLVVR